MKVARKAASLLVEESIREPNFTQATELIPREEWVRILPHLQIERKKRDHLYPLADDDRVRIEDCLYNIIARELGNSGEIKISDTPTRRDPILEQAKIDSGIDFIVTPYTTLEATPYILWYKTGCLRSKIRRWYASPY